MPGNFGDGRLDYLEEHCLVKIYHAKLIPDFVFAAVCAGEKGKEHL